MKKTISFILVSSLLTSCSSTPSITQVSQVAGAALVAGGLSQYEDNKDGTRTEEEEDNNKKYIGGAVLGAAMIYFGSKAENKKQRAIAREKAKEKEKLLAVKKVEEEKRLAIKKVEDEKKRVARVKVQKAEKAAKKRQIAIEKERKEKRKKDFAKLVKVSAGFDNKEAGGEKIVDTIPWYPIGGTKYLQKNLPIVVSGISVDGQNHTVMVKVKLEVDRHTEYVQCIKWFCSKPEDNTDTYTKTITINTTPRNIATERSVIKNVALQGARQGYIYYQGKRITVKDARISFEVLSVK